MSYPSIVGILEQMQVTNLLQATPKQQEEALWRAFQEDLPLGVEYLRKMAQEVLSGAKRLLKVEDPNSALGKQLIRLLGTDVARPICERRLRVCFGFYNCCSVVAAETREDLNISLVEQIQLQNGTLASADC